MFMLFLRFQQSSYCPLPLYFEPKLYKQIKIAFCTLNFGSVGFVDARAQLFKHLTQTPHDRNENTRTHSNSEMLEHVKTETGNDFKMTKK